MAKGLNSPSASRHTALTSARTCIIPGAGRIMLLVGTRSLRICRASLYLESPCWAKFCRRSYPGVVLIVASTNDDESSIGRIFPSIRPSQLPHSQLPKPERWAKYLICAQQITWRVYGAIEMAAAASLRPSTPWRRARLPRNYDTSRSVLDAW